MEVLDGDIVDWKLLVMKFRSMISIVSPGIEDTPPGANNKVY